MRVWCSSGGRRSRRLQLCSYLFPPRSSRSSLSPPHTPTPSPLAAVLTNTADAGEPNSGEDATMATQSGMSVDEYRKSKAEAKLMQLTDSLEADSFKAGKAIIKEGDDGDRLYLVKAGSVKITKKGAEGKEEEEIETVGPSGFFGELALLTGNKRAATATAVDDVQVLSIKQKVFDKLFGSIGELLNNPKLDPTVKATVMARIPESVRAELTATLPAVATEATAAVETPAAAAAPEEEKKA